MLQTPRLLHETKQSQYATLHRDAGQKQRPHKREFSNLEVNGPVSGPKTRRNLILPWAVALITGVHKNLYQESHPASHALSDKVT